MKYLLLLILCSQVFVAQSQNIKTQFINKIPLNADQFIGVDTFENYYYVIGTALYKKTTNNTYVYNNTSLGGNYSVDLSNPLKIVLFYRDFNTVVILDNRLNELTDSINFSAETFGKNVASVSLSSNNNLWLYSLDDNILSLWNYETKKTIFNTQPLSFYEENFEASEQISSYTYCWMISNNGILQFNEYGSFVNDLFLPDVENVVPYLNGYFYIKDAMVYYNSNGESTVVLKDGIQHKIDHFTIAKNNLYFFDANVLYKYGVLKK